MVAFWEQGVILSSAPEVFASDVARVRQEASLLVFNRPDEARKLAQSINDEKLVASIEKLQSKNRKYGNFVAMQGLNAIGSLAAKADPRRVLKDDVLSQIHRHKLIAFGYSLPRDSEDTPKRLPDDVWTGDVDWSNSAVSGAGLSFVSVRLVECGKVEHHEASGRAAAKSTPVSKQPIGPKKSGRKSRKGEILAAYHALQRDAIVSQDTPKAILGHKVREFIFKGVSRSERRETGLSDETIRRIVRGKK
jgi:hypothetical protein